MFSPLFPFLPDIRISDRYSPGSAHRLRPNNWNVQLDIDTRRSKAERGDATGPPRPIDAHPPSLIGSIAGGLPVDCRWVTGGSPPIARPIPPGWPVRGPAGASTFDAYHRYALIHWKNYIYKYIYIFFLGLSSWNNELEICKETVERSQQRWRYCFHGQEAGASQRLYFPSSSSSSSSSGLGFIIWKIFDTVKVGQKDM